MVWARACKVQVADPLCPRPSPIRAFLKHAESWSKKSGIVIPKETKKKMKAITRGQYISTKT
jgi:hypothetical protein